MNSRHGVTTTADMAVLPVVFSAMEIACITCDILLKYLYISNASNFPGKANIALYECQAKLTRPFRLYSRLGELNHKERMVKAQDVTFCILCGNPLSGLIEIGGQDERLVKGSWDWFGLLSGRPNRRGAGLYGRSQAGP